MGKQNMNFSRPEFNNHIKARLVKAYLDMKIEKLNSMIDNFCEWNQKYIKRYMEVSKIVETLRMEGEWQRQD